MIDLKNKPEGATHYAGDYDCHQYMKNITNVDYEYYSTTSESWKVGRNMEILNQAVAIDPWSIYNNTLTLSELSDEQAGELFNYWRKGGDIEFKNHLSGWECEVPEWIPSLVYRAKQKTERELFVDAGMNGCSFDNAHADTVRNVLGQMFDAGFKAPKGER